MTEDMLRYVYAVVRTGSLPLPDGLRGVGGAPVEAVARDEIAAVVSPVPAVDFDEEPLRAHLEDMRRLELLARGHQEVVAAVSARGCALPLRLATVCRGEPGVRRMLAADRGLLEAAFRALDGRDEWGVKAYADPAPAPGDGPAPSVPGARPGTEPGAEPATAPGGAGDRPSSGRDYLRRRRQQRLSRDESTRRAGDWARTAHEALGAAAERCRLHPPQDARLSGVTGENVLNGAYLVSREEAASFAALAAGLVDRADGLRVELTGPWAPYSFTGTAGTAGSAGADSSDRAVRPDGADRSGPADRADRPARSDLSDRPQRADLSDRAEEPG